MVTRHSLNSRAGTPPTCDSSLRSNSPSAPTVFTCLIRSCSSVISSVACSAPIASWVTRARASPASSSDSTLDPTSSSRRTAVAARRCEVRSALTRACSIVGAMWAAAAATSRTSSADRARGCSLSTTSTPTARGGLPIATATSDSIPKVSAHHPETRGDAEVSVTTGSPE